MCWHGWWKLVMGAVVGLSLGQCKGGHIFGCWGVHGSDFVWEKVCFCCNRDGNLYSLVQSEKNAAWLVVLMWLELEQKSWDFWVLEQRWQKTWRLWRTAVMMKRTKSECCWAESMMGEWVKQRGDQKNSTRVKHGDSVQCAVVSTKKT